MAVDTAAPKIFSMGIKRMLRIRLRTVDITIVKAITPVFLVIISPIAWEISFMVSKIIAIEIIGISR